MEATIQEGSVGRKFSPVDKLKIDLQNSGGESLWVPEESVHLEDLHTQNNGTYYVSSLGIYGWDTIIVDVDTSINGGDNDDLWDDDDYWDETPDPDDWPGWDDLDPEEKEDFDDWIDDGGDPDDWPGWDDLDPEEKEDFDDWISADEDLTDDWDQEPDEDWEDENLDDYDDIVGEDLDGDDVAIGVDEDGYLDEESCPASIKIMHVPNKTEYTDGWAIDYDGLVVQAFDADGNQWSSPEYPDGYIPVHKLSLPKYADGSGEKHIEYAGFPVLPDNQSAEYYWDSGGNSIPGGFSGVFDFGVIRATVSGGWIRIENTRTGGAQGYVMPGKDPDGKIETGARFWISPLGIVGCARHFTGSLLAGSTGIGVGDVDYEEVNGVEVKWSSPCLDELTTSFSIKVNESSDHDGTHHSGRF